jgi:protein-disulfide isomerase
MAESRGLGDKARGRAGRLRPYAGTVVVLAVVFGGSALVGAHVRAGKADKVKAPTGAASPDQLALPVRPSVPVTVTVYEDLRSPASKAFAERFHDTFDALLNSGQAQLYYHLVTTTDSAVGGDGSLQAANAAACAQDQGRFRQYVDQLWLAQPSDVSDDAFAGQKLLTGLSKKAHKIKAANFVPCVQGMDHEGWVKQSQRDFKESGFTGVPVVEVGGEVVASGPRAAGKLTPGRLRSLVRKAARQAAAEAAATASPTGSASPSGSAFGH